MTATARITATESLSLLESLKSVENMVARVVSSVHGVLNAAEVERLYNLRAAVGMRYISGLGFFPLEEG